MSMPLLCHSALSLPGFGAGGDGDLARRRPDETGDPRLDRAAGRHTDTPALSAHDGSVTVVADEIAGRLASTGTIDSQITVIESVGSNPTCPHLGSRVRDM